MPDIRMPQLGESVSEGTLGKWLKQVGDRVVKYEPLVEVTTDKVNTEIPADFDGVLTEILVQEGETVTVGTRIATYSDVSEQKIEQLSVKPDAGALSTAIKNQADSGLGAGKATADKAESGRFSPVVMRLLQEHGIDPKTVTGTGLGGRITRKDIYNFLEKRTPQETVSASASVLTNETTKPMKEQAVIETRVVKPVENQVLPKADPAKVLANGDQIIPASPIRKTIAKRMVESKHTAPHAWTMVEVDVTSLVKFRTKIKSEFKRREGIDLTYLPFFIKAVTETLREVPIINSEWSNDSIIVKKDINISIAVGTEDALVVPVIHHTDRLSITGIAHAIHDLATRARSGTLSIADIQGGTFTVNNTGAFGSVLSAPILNSPQAAILTMETIVKRPVVLADDAIAIRSMLNMCMSLDHRVLDGVVSGRFLQGVKRRLQEYGENTIL